MTRGAKEAPCQILGRPYGPVPPPLPPGMVSPPALCDSSEPTPFSWAKTESPRRALHLLRIGSCGLSRAAAVAAGHVLLELHGCHLLSGGSSRPCANGA